MPFDFKRLRIPDIILIEPVVFDDKRGFFLESYKHSDFKDFGINEIFFQDNQSRSWKDVLRGLHYQSRPKAQGKLVSVVRGSVFDVAVDIRKNSQTYKQWVAVELTEVNHKMLYIPAGFAHGFFALTDDVLLSYKCTDEYSSEHDRGIRWNDPDIAIEWPMRTPLVSEKDEKLPFLKDAEIFE
jgi:dTDP-4-dehydrorhamnose 3,5-epimerase